MPLWKIYTGSVCSAPNKVSEKLATEVNLFINKRPTDKRANKWPNNRCRNPEEKIRQGPEPQ